MYTTITGILKKIDQRILIQLCNDQGRAEHEIDLQDTNDPVVVKFTQAAVDARDEIDPYLRGRYPLPLNPVPGIIIAISDEVTKYNLHKRRGKIPEDIEQVYRAQVKMLEKIEAGKMDIGVAGAPQSISNEISTNKTASDRIFNKRMWDKY